MGLVVVEWLTDCLYKKRRKKRQTGASKLPVFVPVLLHFFLCSATCITALLIILFSVANILKFTLDILTDLTGQWKLVSLLVNNLLVNVSDIIHIVLVYLYDTSSIWGLIDIFVVFAFIFLFHRENRVICFILEVFFIDCEGEMVLRWNTLLTLLLLTIYFVGLVALQHNIHWVASLLWKNVCLLIFSCFAIFCMLSCYGNYSKTWFVFKTVVILSTDFFSCTFFKLFILN